MSISCETPPFASKPISARRLSLKNSATHSGLEPVEHGDARQTGRRQRSEDRLRRRCGKNFTPLSPSRLVSLVTTASPTFRKLRALSSRHTRYAWVCSIRAPR
jgi:hypothetical protein